MINEDFVRTWLTQNELQKNVCKLAAEPRTSRIVQLALQIAASENDGLVKKYVGELKDWVKEAVDSPHANHVLQKAIEYARPSFLPFVVPELLACFSSPAEIAKHQYGCRVLERLLEHFEPEALQEIVYGIVKDPRTVEELSKNMFASFVLQHILEYGEAGSRQRIVEALCTKFLPVAAKNQYARGVLDKALTYGSPQDQHRLAAKLVDEGLVCELAAARAPGSDAAVRVFQVLPRGGPHWLRARKQVKEQIEQAKNGKHVREVLEIVGIGLLDGGEHVDTLETSSRLLLSYPGACEAADTSQRDSGFGQSKSCSSSACSTVVGSPVLGTSPALGGLGGSSLVNTMMTELKLPPPNAAAAHARPNHAAAHAFRCGAAPMYSPPGYFVQHQGFADEWATLPQWE
jgi:hypothetical protein